MRKIMLLGSALAVSLGFFTGAMGAPGEAAAQTAPQEAPREVEVVVERGYHPSRIEVAPGARVRLRFVRREWSGCTREVVFPTLDLRRALPVNQPVVVEFTAPATGEVPFRCGMNMVRGAVVVRPSP
jgi:plastocyanin domain-containing protein